MTKEVRIKQAVWETLKILGGPKIRVSAKGFSKRRTAAKVPLTYLLAASHVNPNSVNLDQSLAQTSETLARRLHRRIAIVTLSSSNHPTVYASTPVKDDGSRLSIACIVKDLDDHWRWIMWEDRATLDLPNLLAATCPASTNPTLDIIRRKLLQ